MDVLEHAQLNLNILVVVNQVYVLYYVEMAQLTMEKPVTMEIGTQEMDVPAHVKPKVDIIVLEFQAHALCYVEMVS